MRFQYQALQRDGRVVTGLLDAPSERNAHRDLLKRGVHPIAIRATAAPVARTWRPKRKISSRSYASMLKQMHALIAGGVPIAEAIGTPPAISACICLSMDA